MDGRRDSKKNRNSTKGGRHQSEAENEISDGENLNQSQTDADLVNDFRNTLHTLNTQFTDLENQYRRVVRENHDLRRQITKLEGLVDKEGVPEIARENHQSPPDLNRSSGIPKSKSHFSKLKKAYNETTSKVSTVVQQGFRASGHNQTRGIELSCPPIIAHKDAILDISSSEARTGIFASTSMDKTAKIWNESGQCFTKYTGHRGAVNSISIHSTKHLAITGSGDSECHLWSFKEPAENEPLGADFEPINCTNPILRYGSHTEVVSCVRFVGIEKICTAGLDGQAQIHDLETSKKLIDLKGHESGLNHCSVSESNPNLITTSSKDGSIRIWDCRNNRANILCVNTQHRQPVSATLFYNENQIISSSDDKTIRVFDFRHNRPIDRINLDSSANKIDISSHNHLALPHDDGNIRLFKMNSNNRLKRIRNRHQHHHPVTAVAWLSSNENRSDLTLVSGSWDRKIFIWRIPHSFFRD